MGAVEGDFFVVATDEWMEGPRNSDDPAAAMSLRPDNQIGKTPSSWKAVDPDTIEVSLRGDERLSCPSVNALEKGDVLIRKLDLPLA